MKEKMNLILGDSIKILKTFPENSIDCVITDPPYKLTTGGREKGHQKYRGKFAKENYDNNGDLFEIPKFSDWIPLISKSLRVGGDFYIMTNDKNMTEILVELKIANLKIHNILFWNKGKHSGPNRWYLKYGEFIIYAYKPGKCKSINVMGSSTYISIPSLRNSIHPTEKPVELMEYMVKNHNGVVLDPFMGVGSTGMACKRLGNSFIGIEKNKEYFNIASSRLAESE